MTATVIYGADLIKVMKRYNQIPQADSLDPEGWNLVTFHMLHNDQGEIRLNLLCKTKGNNHPVETTTTMMLSDFNKIVRHMDPDTGTLTNN